MPPTPIEKETRQLVRIAILVQVQTAGTRGLTLSSLQIGVRASGVKADHVVIEEEVAYLTDKKFIRQVEPEVSPEIWRAAITADGRDFLAKEGY